MAKILQLPKYLHPDFSQPGRKPVGPVEIDSAENINSGLILSYLFDGPNTRDLVRNNENTVSGTPISTITAGQKAIGFDAQSDSLELFAGPDLDPGNAMTLVIVQSFRDTTGRFIIDWFGQNPGNTSGEWIIIQTEDTDQVAFYFGGFGASDYLNVTYGSKVADEVNVWVFRAGSQGMYIWLNGTLLGSHTNATSRSVQSSGESMHLNAGYNSTGDLQDVYALSMWGRELSDGEVAAVTRNAYRLYRPAIPQHYFISDGAGGGQSIVPGLITENGTLFSVSPSPGGVSVSPSLITENEALFNIAAGLSTPVTLITENTSLFPLGIDMTVPVGLITENGSLFAIEADMALAVGLITENESLFNVGADLAVPVTLITENESLFSTTAVPGGVSISVGLIVENTSLFDVTPVQGGIVAVSLITENGTLFATTPLPGGIEQTVTLITENESLFGVTADHTIPVTIITENGTLFDVTPAPGAVGVVPGLIVENETLFAITVTTQNKTATVAGITGGQNLTNLSYCVIADYDIGVGSIIQQGSAAESTDANGDLVIDLSTTSVNDGDPLIIIITDFTASPSVANRGAVCHTTATVV